MLSIKAPIGFPGINLKKKNVAVKVTKIVKRYVINLLTT